MSRFQPTPATAPMPTPNPMGIFPPVPPLIRPKTYSSTPATAGMPTIAALQQRQEELTAPKMPAIQDPLQGAAYLTDILSTNLQENAALNMEGQQRQKLAEIAGGALGGGGVTPEMVQQAMAIDPEGMGAFLYKQAMDARNAEKWEPVPGHPEVQRNTVTGELKESHMGGAGEYETGDIITLHQKFKSDPAYTNLANANPIWTSMQDAMKRDTPQADLNMVIALAKLFDPTSVVRSQEGDQVLDTGGVPQQIIGLFKQLKGDPTSRLGPEVRAGMIAEARSRMEGYQQAYTGLSNYYTDMAKRHGFDPRDVVIPPGFGPQEKPEETPTTAEPTPMPDDPKLLKAGTTYVDDVGVTKVYTGANPAKWDDPTNWKDVKPAGGQ